VARNSGASTAPTLASARRSPDVTSTRRADQGTQYRAEQSFASRRQDDLAGFGPKAADWWAGSVVVAHGSGARPPSVLPWRFAVRASPSNEGSFIKPMAIAAGLERTLRSAHLQSRGPQSQRESDSQHRHPAIASSDAAPGSGLGIFFISRAATADPRRQRCRRTPTVRKTSGPISGGSLAPPECPCDGWRRHCQTVADSSCIRDVPVGAAGSRRAAGFARGTEVQKIPDPRQQARAPPSSNIAGDIIVIRGNWQQHRGSGSGRKLIRSNFVDFFGDKQLHASESDRESFDIAFRPCFFRGRRMVKCHQSPQDAF